MTRNEKRWKIGPEGLRYREIGYPKEDVPVIVGRVVYYKSVRTLILYYRTERGVEKMEICLPRNAKVDVSKALLRRWEPYYEEEYEGHKLVRRADGTLQIIHCRRPPRGALDWGEIAVDLMRQAGALGDEEGELR